MASFVVTTACVTTFCVLTSLVVSMPANYAQSRQSIISYEQERRVGGYLNQDFLTPEERILDNELLNEKRQIIEASRLNGSDFPAAHNFMTSRTRMESTRAFQIIKKMPKGGALHVHKTAMASIDWLVKNVTYRPNLYMCVDDSSYVQFLFRDHRPNNTDCDWKLLSEERAKHDVATFDQYLYNNLSLVTPDPDKAYPSVNRVWEVFEGYFRRIGGLTYYAPVWWDYNWESLRQFYEDNVQYVEIRGSIPRLYELDGTQHPREWSIINVYKPLLKQFADQYHDFIGAKQIIVTFRGISYDDMLDTVKEAMEMYKKYPDFILGFDLVGQEDPYKPLTDFIDALLYPSQQNPPVNLPYFFHAGETDWQETATDYNLLDALLLNTTRIGHGYALYKHPTLMDMVKNRGIAVEVNPISNQVLKLVDDLRNHPAASLLADSFPIVISSDDPAVWGAAPLSHDFYVTFMALLGEETGLGALKELAMNSLVYSAMPPQEKAVALGKWQTSWHTFVNELTSTPPTPTQ